MTHSIVYVFSLVPTFVWLPVAVTVTVSSVTRPETETSASVSAVPSYFLAAEPVVTVSAAGVTVSVPSTGTTSVKLSVTSLPKLSRIVYETMVFALLPASVWLPETTAETVKPAGRPSAVTVSSVRAVPS